MDEVLKNIPYVDIGKSTGLHEKKFVFASEVGGKLASDFALTRMLLGQVQLVAHEHDYNLGLSVLPNLLNPLLYRHKALLLRYIVYDQSPDRLAIVAILQERVIDKVGSKLRR